MRLAQYIVLLIFGVGGLLLGDRIGPLYDVIGHWEVGMYDPFVRAVRLFHGVVLGACVTLPMLIVGRLFKINDLPIFAASLLLAATFFLLEILTAGRLFPTNPLLLLPMFAASFVVGSMASFGAVYLVQRIRAAALGGGAP